METKKQKWKKPFAVLLALSLIISMFAVVVQASTVKVYLVEIPRSTDNEQNGWTVSDLSLRNGWVAHNGTQPTGKALSSYDGEAVYCLEISSPVRTGDEMTKYTSSQLNDVLPNNGALTGTQQQRLLSYILYYGYQGNVNSSTWVSQNSTGAKQLAKYYATQLLVWEVVVGERDINFNYLTKSQTGAKNAVIEYMRSNNPLRSSILNYYNTMVSQIQKALIVPSFMSRNYDNSTDTYELEYQSKEDVYEVSLKDTNNVLNNFNFSGDGLTFKVNGNVLTIQSEKPISKGVKITATKKTSNTVVGTVVWGDGKIDVKGNGKQDVLANGAELKDPLNAYVKVTSGEAKTSAVDSDTGIQNSFADEEVTIVDTVTYSGLTVGKKYTVSGTLMDKETGKALTVNGKEITATSTFTPKSTSGSVDVLFKFDGTGLAGKTAVAFETITTDGKTVTAHANINDKDQTIYFPKLKTSAVDSDTGIQNALADEEVTIVDTVSYSNLIPGKEYTVSGTLMDKETGEALSVDGKEVTASTTFTPKASTGTVDVPFTFNGTGLAGKTVVAYERLSYTGKEVAVHVDIEDEEQTIWFPDGHTTAIDSDTGIQNSLADEEVTIVDTVSYSNLIPGKEYTVSGTLMDKETGEALTVDGEAVTASTTFTPEESSGTVDVSFTFNGTGLAGKTVVAFETVTYNGKTVFTHADLEDEQQTVYFPNGYTTASDKLSNTQMVDNKEEVTVIDTVSYSNLIPGKEYTVSGTLMDKETGEALSVDGKEVTANTTFTPEETSGTVDVSFTFNGTGLAGKTVVAFETVSYNGKTVFTHADLEDEQQTVYFPKLHTTAVDGADGDKTLAYSDTVTIVDTVSYENLVPNMEYKLVATLMNKETGKAVTADGKEVTAEVIFVPTETTGTENVEITFDVTGVKNGEYVVFEKLYDTVSNETVGHHEDLKDEGQTVTIPKTPTPNTGDDYTKAIILAVAGVASVAGISFILYKKKKSKLNG